MKAAEIFAGLDRESQNVLARYFRYTIAQEGPPHDPRRVAEVLLQLPRSARERLSDEVRQRLGRRAA